MAPHPDELAPAPIDPAGHEAHLSKLRKGKEPATDDGFRREGDGLDLRLLGQKIVLAGLSNMAASLVTNPFDLIKVRQQLESKSISKTGQTSTKSTFWFKTLTNMVKTEGIGSIYKGLSASMLREGSYSAIRMGGYDLAKKTWCSVFPFVNPEGFGAKLGAGMTSGMIGAAVANPADLLKVRLQSLAATGTLRQHIQQVYQGEGIKGFYRAIFPTTVRAGILTASQLGCYDQSKYILKRDFSNTFKEGMQTHLVASAIAGFCCSATSNPVDVVKVRIMSDKTGRYSNALQCAALILKDEGPFAFYKGFSMCFLRLWPHSILSLLVFEQLRKNLGLAPI
ncbi:uncharacterized protein JCM6883_002327 [Sporobolomyces salmoneus]|uniref:uncharacterized protein n=1 Tax=Sporobolomyces salmoneus TaxID=183962 RepID=UPI00317261DA